VSRLYRGDGYLPIENFGYHRDKSNARSFIKTFP
jgi:hypothetical protein